MKRKGNVKKDKKFRGFFIPSFLFYNTKGEKKTPDMSLDSQYIKMSLAWCESMKGRKDEEERRRGGALSLYKYPIE